MAGYVTYLALLVFWMLLVYPGWRLRGGKRGFVLAVAGIGALGAVYEAWLFFIVFPGASNPIRIDILLIAPLLWGLYAGAVATLFRARRTKMVTALGIIVALIGAEIVYLAAETGRESARLTANFHERNALLFAAKFRSQGDYEAYFGPFGEAAHPVGHWVAQEHWQYTRLIVNADAQVWLFYRCSEAECHYRSAGGLRQRDDGLWETVVSARMLQDLPLTIDQDGPESLAVEINREINREINGKSLSFTAAPPPIDPMPAPESLTYIGSFSGHSCIRLHAMIRQVWLWRDGDRLYALGVFRTLVAGRNADFISPVMMGSGQSAGGVWAFDWDAGDRRSGKAEITLEGPNVSLLYEGSGREPERLSLAQGAIVEDEFITLAPLSGAEDWRHWFDVVFTGHFSSGDVPDCPGS